MSTFVKANTFVLATANDPTPVNQNFDDIVTFLNNSVSHADGSKPFTGQVSLPAVDPTTANQAARKAYVDAQVALKVDAAALAAAVAVETAARAAGDTAEGGARVAGDASTLASAVSHVAGGRSAFTSDGNGDFTITFGKTMSSTPGVTVVPGQISSIIYAVTSVSTSSCTVRMFNPATAAALPSRTETVSWTAVAS